MLKLRPHHLLDIVRDYGNDKAPGDHPHGADVKGVTEAVLADPSQKVEFVLEPDSICRPCAKLDAGGHCTATIRANPPVSMAAYNDTLDGRLFALLDLQPGVVLGIDEFLSIVASHMPGVASLFVSPNASIEARAEGTRKGLTKFGILRGD
jgi:hypothetical protein